MYMPPNVTPLIQPMDQNAIRLLKLHYRNSLLSKIVSSNENLETSLKQTTLFEAVSLVALAWEKVSSDSIKKCWKKILGDDNFEDEDDIPLSVVRDSEEIRAISKMHNLLHANFPNSQFDFLDLFEWNLDDPSEEIELDDDVDEDNILLVPDNNSTKVKHADAINCFDTCIKWAVENNIETSKILLLRSLHEKAVEISLKSNKRQCLMTDFLNK